MNHYYQLLGLKAGASIEEIKRAYRTKAKLLHPDVNKSPTAERDFIALNEAYEYLLNVKKGIQYDSVSEKFQKAPTSPKNWENYKRKEAQKRAAYHAQMAYEEFINSKYYKEGILIEDFFLVVEIAIYFGMIVLFPLYLLVEYDMPGFILMLFFAFILSPAWGRIVYQNKYPSWSNVYQGFILTSQAFSIRVAFCVVFFVIAFFAIGFKTFISFSAILKYILIIYFTLLLINGIEYKLRNSRLLLKNFSLSLLIVGVLLFLNYFISFNEKEEHLLCKQGHYGQIVTVSGQYDYCPSVFFYFETKSVFGAIKFKTKQGILGYKVYTERTP